MTPVKSITWEMDVPRALAGRCGSIDNLLTLNQYCGTIVHLLKETTMKWNVTAVAMDRDTRQMKSLPRTELIVPKENQLFLGCKTALDVEITYEHFWNDLNKNSREIVKVIGVEFIR
jgi:hypothetical protein